MLYVHKVLLIFTQRKQNLNEIILNTFTQLYGNQYMYMQYE